MKIFTFRYEKCPQRSALMAIRAAARTKKADVRPHEMVCDSIETLLRVMSKSRFEAFAAIVEHRPQSLYELATLLEKDQGNVLRDARSLETLGLIQLVHSHSGGRERLSPEPLYEKIVVEIFPKRRAKAV